MIRRLGSPSGPSTLMTSAPQSPSTTAAAGAAMNELMSSTRNPASGRAVSVMDSPFRGRYGRDALVCVNTARFLDFGTRCSWQNREGAADLRGGRCVDVLGRDRDGAAGALLAKAGPRAYLPLSF